MPSHPGRPITTEAAAAMRSQRIILCRSDRGEVFYELESMRGE